METTQRNIAIHLALICRFWSLWENISLRSCRRKKTKSFLFSKLCCLFVLVGEASKSRTSNNAGPVVLHGNESTRQQPQRKLFACEATWSQGIVWILCSIFIEMDIELQSASLDSVAACVANSEIQFYWIDGVLFPANRSPRSIFIVPYSIICFHKFEYTLAASRHSIPIACILQISTLLLFYQHDAHTVQSTKRAARRMLLDAITLFHYLFYRILLHIFPLEWFYLCL